MKKSEIIQIAFIILGIGIIFKTFLSLFEHLNFSFNYMNEYPSDYSFVLTILVIVALLIIIGLLLISKSKYLSKKVIKEESDEIQTINLNKSDIIQISVVILCLYFIVIYSPEFISSISSVIINFTGDFNMYKEMLPKNIWSIILYISIFVILVYSKKFSNWLKQKIF